MSGPYVYIQSETARETGNYPLYTVGFYRPNDTWEPESDYGGPTGKDDAAARVAYLNGGGKDEPEPMKCGGCGATRLSDCECRGDDQ